VGAQRGLKSVRVVDYHFNQEKTAASKAAALSSLK
jgi:hypothetical protein